MNCEKCKNKKATVFYADEGGFRHSLCAGCASVVGRASEYSPSSTLQGEDIPFTPPSSLTALLFEPLPAVAIYLPYDTFKGNEKCSFCGTELHTVQERGSVGCPDCYAVFGRAVFPETLAPEEALGARMPSCRRASIDRNRSIAELKTKIKIAIESENYELAADLRDRIKALEARTTFKK